MLSSLRSSQKIHCPCCSTQPHANGQVTYFHSVLTPVVVKPGVDKVLPLAPEFVHLQDGHAKPDCELYAPLGVTVLGDERYCHEPFCRELLAEGFEFILVCKPESHPLLYEWIEFLDRSGSVKTRVRKRWTGKRYEIDTYRYVTTVPLRDGDDALAVNWGELTTITADGQMLYHNAFATSHALEEGNVVEVVAAGRSRWKIENENNNTLKSIGLSLRA